jgi:hypothetical protein
MISAQTLRVCREGKSLRTFPDHAPAAADRPDCHKAEPSRTPYVFRAVFFAESFVMIRLSIAVALLVANVPFAFAQHAGTPQEQNACSRDASRFCRKDLGNDGAVQACLQQHRSRLSASCRKVFESHGM